MPACAGPAVRAMKALELAHVGPERVRCHAPVAEYDAYLEHWIDQPVYQRMLRHAATSSWHTILTSKRGLLRRYSSGSVVSGAMGSAPRARPMATRRAPTCTTSA